MSSYQDLAAQAERFFPQFLQALMPRRFRAPGQFPSEKVPAVCLALAAGHTAVRIAAQKDQPDETTLTMVTQAWHLTRNLVPVFYVSKDLILAASLTSLPDDLDLESLPFPFPAMTFMLPRGAWTNGPEGSCPYLCVSKVRKGEPHGLLTLHGGEDIWPSARTTLGVTVAMDQAPAVPFYYLNVEALGTLKQSLPDLDAIPFDVSHASEPTGVDLEGKDFCLQSWFLALKLVLIMLARPNLVEHGRLEKRVKGKRAGKGVEYWSPNFVDFTRARPPLVRAVFPAWRLES